ncbi:MAG: hypothetical protein NC355_01660 [Blautia sp.]|nr:hypothetical protein [Blautia sp.]MCM1282074.1 hypothetical protein [Roseburia sp.]MCM1431106.1 hypothetical protein [Muribaculaceae bacterium]MCM1492529.1 hypothetical protein [Muribaculaceae bacterium]
MEKTWDDFWASGKVTDYLTYRDAVADREKAGREQKDNGSGGASDGDGTFRHACR